MPRGKAEVAREPQYVDEVEVLIDPFFIDDEEERKLKYDGVGTLDPAAIDARHSIYIGGLRILAEARHEERKSRGALSTEEWNSIFSQSLTRRKIEDMKLRHGHTLDALSERLAVANQGRKPRHDVEDIMSGLYEHQKPYMRRVAAF